jgi:Toxin PAAR-like domain
MLPASHRGDGTSIGTPDVCNTPSASGVTPVSYTNTAVNSQASTFSATTLICNQSALNISSNVSTTSGDEAGTSSPIKGPQIFTTGSAVVFIDNQPAVRLTSTTTHNSGNCAAGTQTAPSASNVLMI